MATLRIPRRYHAALSDIKDRSSDDIEQLVSVLNDAPASVELTDIVSFVKSRLSKDGEAGLKVLIETILSLNMVRASSEQDVEAFAKDVIQAMNDAGEPTLKVSAEAHGELGRRLVRLLSIANLNLAAKSLALRGEFQQTFCEARILTDLRPVFGENPSAVLGAAITHTLKLEYHQNHQHREIYLALDDQDLVKLSDIISRAQAKAVSLGALLKNVISIGQKS